MQHSAEQCRDEGQEGERLQDPQLVAGGGPGENYPEREKCRFVMFAGGRAEGRRRGQAARDASRGLRHSVAGDKRLHWRVVRDSHPGPGILHHHPLPDKTWRTNRDNFASLSRCGVAGGGQPVLGTL